MFFNKTNIINKDYNSLEELFDDVNISFRTPKYLPFSQIKKLRKDFKVYKFIRKNQPSTEQVVIYYEDTTTRNAVRLHIDNVRYKEYKKLTKNKKVEKVTILNDIEAFCENLNTFVDITWMMDGLIYSCLYFSNQSYEEQKEEVLKIVNSFY